MADLIGQVYNQRKQAKGGDRKSNYQTEDLISETAEAVASELGVGRATVHKSPQNEDLIALAQAD